MPSKVNIYFSDFFNIHPDVLEEYGAFNISLVNDLPLFVDPFLLFNSDDPKYIELHESMIKYLKFLRDKSASLRVTRGLLDGLYVFPEVKQNWLGFSRAGNRGSGLGPGFGRSLDTNLRTVFASFGREDITEGSHIEKLCLMMKGIGRDFISDFSTNLIKGFLLEYTQELARGNIDPSYCRSFRVSRSRFNYSTQTWERGLYYLPQFEGDYVLLTPKDMLTKDETWINRSDMLDRLQDIGEALPDEVLRAQLNEYLRERLKGKKKEAERQEALEETVQRFPMLIDHYIRYKEDHGDDAIESSIGLVRDTELQFIERVRDFVDNTRLAGSPFYRNSGTTLDEARERVEYLRHVIENNDGYRLFYANDGRPIRREEDLQILYLLTWYATPSDVNREVNNGRGPVDFKVSRGRADKSLVEFKLASNSKLKRNLQKQVEIYQTANQTRRSLKVILYFSEEEAWRVATILKELDMEDNPNIILIDARGDNKPSASVA